MKTSLFFFTGIVIVLNVSYAFAQNDSAKKIIYYALIHGEESKAKVWITDVTDSTLLLKRISNEYEFPLSYREIEKIKIKRSRKPAVWICAGAGIGLAGGLLIGLAAAPPPPNDLSFGNFSTESSMAGGAFIGLVVGTITAATFCIIPTKKIKIHKDQKHFSAAIPVLKKYSVKTTQ